MVECMFVDSKIDRVDFKGVVFEKCRFAGQLREVVFRRHASGGEALPANEMNEVDFRDAELRMVEFRGLDMARVLWPVGVEHVLVYDYIASLRRALAALQRRPDLASRKFCGYLEHTLKWASPTQKCGIFHRADLLRMGGGEGPATELIKLLAGETEQEGSA
jgi:hypothetical protein